jgi:UDPglucose 6-dehydrogenase/GDP-mannose 6-dehydrogenase
VRVSIVGTGYVGLVSGVCLAHLGHDVVCVDLDAAKVERINAGDPPIHERGLEPLLREGLAAGRLEATTDLAAAVGSSELTLIAVGTPFDGQSIDLGYIEGAARQIGAALADKNDYHTVVVKSTVVPGTTDEVVLPLLEAASGRRAGDDFGVGMNPEFLREGEAVTDFMNPDRIVLGGIDERTRDALARLYAVFPGVDLVKTSPRTAETIKYAANSLLATMISFANEMAGLSSAVGGVDVAEVMSAVHLDRRLSPILEDGQRIVPAFTTYLEAGCGFGGSCFPKDVKALIAHGRSAGAPMTLLDAVIAVNEAQPRRVVELLEEGLGALAERRIAVLGLAFKPNTDDMRESPAIPVVRSLAAAGASLVAFDPVAESEARAVFADLDLEYAADLEEAIADAEAIVLMTRWSEFERLPELLSGRDPQPLVVDGRRMLPKDSVARYAGIGLT